MPPLMMTRSEASCRGGPATCSSASQPSPRWGHDRDPHLCLLYVVTTHLGVSLSPTLPPLAAGLRLSRPAALAVLATAMFVIILDSSMVNLAASTIRTGLELSATELTAMANGYLVALAGLMLLGGRLADVLGGRRMFVIGMATYVTASAVSALAVNGPMLLAGRIGQGIGAA